MRRPAIPAAIAMAATAIGRVNNLTADMVPPMNLTPRSSQSLIMLWIAHGRNHTVPGFQHPPGDRGA